MRKQNEIKRAVEVLKKHTDPASLAQLDVLQNRRSETWVFIHYVREVPEEERDPALFYAARDAAQFLTGKISISAICPELDDEPEEEPEPDDDAITLSRKEYEKLLKRLERVERRLGLRVGTTDRAPRKDLSEAPADLISQVDACKYIGCGKSTIKRWADKGLLTGYKKGRSVCFSRKEIDRAPVVKEHRKTAEEEA